MEKGRKADHESTAGPIEGYEGVTVRPPLKITGETGFNEVIFEDVWIADPLRHQVRIV